MDDNREAEYELVFTTAEEGDKEMKIESMAGGTSTPAVFFDPAVMQKVKGRLFALKNNSTKKTAVGFMGPTGRSFNYEQIYDEDNYGEETFPDARVWKVYNDEAQLFDLERIEAWRDAVDVLLVFIGLFAAVVSAFLIETSKTLQPDYAHITAMISFEILRTLNTSVIPHPTLSPNLLDTRFGAASPTRNNDIVNALWYTSLSISLATALLAMLIKQWLHQYMTSTSGTARERARIRHFRYVGLDKYRVPFIIDLLPTLLHIALALFLAGLVVHLKDLHTVMFSLVASISAIPYLFYFISIVIPLFDVQCPYKSPLSSYVHLLSQTLCDYVLKWGWQIKHTWSRTSRWVGRRLARSDVTGNSNEGATEEEEGHISSTTRLLSRGDAEKQAVLRIGDQLDADAIILLCVTSANTDVQHISVEAYGALAPSNADIVATNTGLHARLDPYWEILKCSSAGGANVPARGSENKHDRLLRTLCTRTDWNLDTTYYFEFQPLYQGETEPRKIFSNWLLPWLNASWSDEQNFTALFAFASMQSFPFRVWVTLIQLGTRHRPHDIIIKGLLTAQLPLVSYDEAFQDTGAVTFRQAIHHPVIRLMAMEYLGVSITDSVALISLKATTLSTLLSDENASWLDETARAFHLVAIPHPPFASAVSSFLSQVLPSLFTGLTCELLGAPPLSGDQEELLVTHIATFFESPHADQVSGHTMTCAIDVWAAHRAHSLRAVATPSVIHHVLAQIRRRDSLGTEMVSLYIVPVINDAIERCLTSGPHELRDAVYSGIRQLDILPADIESPCEMTFLGLFWTPAMCKAIVQGTVLYGEMPPGHTTTSDGFQEWVAYLHVPKRLVFLSTRLLSFNEPGLLAGLAQLRPEYSSWPDVVDTIASLFDLPPSIVLHNPSRMWHSSKTIQISPGRVAEGLLEMQKVLVNYHPILSDLELRFPQLKGYALAADQPAHSGPAASILRGASQRLVGGGTGNTSTVSGGGQLCGESAKQSPESRAERGETHTAIDVADQNSRDQDG